MAEIIGNELSTGYTAGSEETSSVTVVMGGLGVINPECTKGVMQLLRSCVVCLAGKEQ